MLGGGRGRAGVGAGLIELGRDGVDAARLRVERERPPCVYLKCPRPG